MWIVLPKRGERNRSNIQHMIESVTLSLEQLEKLQDGESVSVEYRGGRARGGKVTIHPPCDKSGHEWMEYTFGRDDEGRYASRRCKKCNERQKTRIENIDSLFVGSEKNDMVEVGDPQGAEDA